MPWLDDMLWNWLSGDSSGNSGDSGKSGYYADEPPDPRYPHDPADEKKTEEWRNHEITFGRAESTEELFDNVCDCFYEYGYEVQTRVDRYGRTIDYLIHDGEGQAIICRNLNDMIKFAEGLIEGGRG